MKSKIMKFFSDLGRSLMMPVAALAACGIILGITSALLKNAGAGCRTIFDRIGTAFYHNNT